MHAQLVLLVLLGACEGSRVVPEAGILPDCFEDVRGSPNALIADLHLSANDGSVAVRGVRELTGVEIRGGWPSENWNQDNFRLLRFAMVRAETELCVRDPDALEYVSTHHNFADSFRARDAGVHYVVAMSRFEPTPSTITATNEATGEIVWGPVPLESTRCDSNNPSAGFHACPF